jgi:general secretion pathway protein G
LRLPEDLGEIDIQNITDPWGNPYRYLKIAEDDDDETNNWKGKGNNSEKGKKGKVRKTSSQDAINTDYDLYSVGRDGKSESSLDAETSRDDVVRANDGKHIGLASDYK